MLQKRIIPTLLIRERALVKTCRFRRPRYLGDPCNTVMIFNELEADELVILDISPQRHSLGPDFDYLKKISQECFLPLSYGGGVSTPRQAERILSIGFEKVILNTAAVHVSGLIGELAHSFGSQAVVVSVDFRNIGKGATRVFTDGGRQATSWNALDWCRQVEDHGAGEIMLTSIEREGTWIGLDQEISSQIASAVHIPVVAHGGAGLPIDIAKLFSETDVSGVGVGSMFVYQKKNMGVLVNMPPRNEVDQLVQQLIDQRESNF